MIFSKSGQTKLVIIGGPTAAGKTALAIKAAKAIGGEVVSADARQIYRGMDVGTGKELPTNLKFKISAKGGSASGGENLKFDSRNDFTAGYYVISGVRVWLYDVAAPDQYFSAADYRRVTWPVIRDIWRRDKLPLVVGGTGFYIKSLLQGLGSDGIPPDWELREQLAGWTVAQLAERLQTAAPQKWERMNVSDRKNPRRLMRAIEIALKIENLKFKIDDETGNDNLTVSLGVGDALLIGLFAPYPYLYQRIDQRVEEMMKAGLLDEVKTLVKQHAWAAPGMNGIGYRQFRPLLEGKKSSLEECVERVKFDSHAYARRQMTWFKKEPGVAWFDISRAGFDEQALQLVKSFR